jgi:hypothetical protein
MVDFNWDFSPASETDKSVMLLVSLNLFPQAPKRWWFEFDIKAVVDFDFKSLSLFTSGDFNGVYLYNHFFLELP